MMFPCSVVMMWQGFLFPYIRFSAILMARIATLPIEMDNHSSHPLFCLGMPYLAFVVLYVGDGSGMHFCDGDDTLPISCLTLQRMRDVWALWRCYGMNFRGLRINVRSIASQHPFIHARYPLFTALYDEDEHLLISPSNFATYARL